MKFIKGFLIGTLTGFAAGSALSERQRDELRRRTMAVARRQAKPLADRVAEQTSQIADAATDRAVDAVDRVGDQAQDAIRPEGEAATTPL